MTQSQSNQLLSLQLTPMQIPEAVPQSVQSGSLAGMGTQVNSSGQHNLLVHPGEPSEMIVQLKNLGSRPVELSLQVKGDFPQTWCQIGMEGSEVLPRQQMEAVLYFQIPSSFFESNAALNSGSSFKLNYVVNLYVSWLETDTARQYREQATFNLYVRPRSLYLNFLPAIYRDIDFIGRFLKIFEQSFEPCVHTLDNLWAYLDPIQAPQAILPFLAHWVGWNQSPQIGVERQRKLIKNAMQIYRLRGTRGGLRFYLHLATGLPLDEHLPEETNKHIGIVEYFRRGFVFGEAKIGEDTIVGGGCPFHFAVYLRPLDANQIDELLVRNVIEQEKPAFSTYDLYIEPRSNEYVSTDVSITN
ncbi:hypothetical protein NIES267_10360 [Calothrix parasitica NIES-267]|uniref:Phage tail protein n=1 Tax=Calothrix parasitica NIES-267 TaxID=1973488 RepID=A0A1Z4LK62_9CYAN|nr:hypothetical protein NIES267_10360 [Calothrix parasitica NIES-267]